jgi:hypothetical protein
MLGNPSRDRIPGPEWEPDTRQQVTGRKSGTGSRARKVISGLSHHVTQRGNQQHKKENPKLVTGRSPRLGQENYNSYERINGELPVPRLCLSRFCFEPQQVIQVVMNGREAR